jgi:hypothetical protein
MWSFLQSLSPAFRRAKAQGELIEAIHKTLDDGRVDVAAHGVGVLIREYHRMPSTVPAVIEIVDRVDMGITYKEHPEAGVYKDKLSLGYESAREAQRRFDNSGFGKWLNETFGDADYKPTYHDIMLNAVCHGVHGIVMNHERDQSIVPTVEKLLHRVIQSDPERALSTAEYIADLASPHWLGFRVPEDITFTGHYKAKQPLKKVAVQELLHISDEAHARKNLKLAFMAAASAEKFTYPTPDWKDIHETAVAKRAEMAGKWFSGMGYY